METKKSPVNKKILIIQDQNMYPTLNFKIVGIDSNKNGISFELASIPII